MHRLHPSLGALAFSCLLLASAAPAQEVRGTWLTTTANSAIATPASTAATMRKLKEIGINTVYVESWKDGRAQFPSRVMERTTGVERAAQERDLVEETLIEAHRNGLVYVSWFEYGFMAAHKDSLNALRRSKPEWLSRDRAGSEVAPNGFVWLNPMHPQASRFLLDLILEAVDRYDLDGIQLDDRIVWPHVTMGYDAYTVAAYAAEHGGHQPPVNVHDPQWMRWRANTVNQFARQLVREVRARRPELIISLSPAVHPWAWENYLLDWPSWSKATTPRWDEFIPQAYRFSYASFETTWLQQVAAMREHGGDRQRDLLAGIRVVGDGADSSWEQLRGSIELTRKLGNGGHVLWFSRGVLDVYAAQLRSFYLESGAAQSPRVPQGWRPASIALTRVEAESGKWRVPALPAGHYRLIGNDGAAWHYLGDAAPASVLAGRVLPVPPRFTQVELLMDRRYLARRAARSTSR